MKKITCMILTFILLLPMVPRIPVSAAVADWKDAAAAAAFLQRLGVIEIASEEQFKTPVTRGAFATFVVALLQSNGIEAAATDYYDVPPTHENYHAIMYLRQLGIMNGYTDNTFRPNEQITRTDAVVTLVSCMGYRVKVYFTGGYPTGYLAVASEAGILGEESLNGGLDYAYLYQLAVRALTAPMLQTTGYSDSLTYQTSEDVTLLSEYYGIYQDTSIMFTNQITSLTGSKPAAGWVEIGETRYLSDGTYDQLLGYQIIYYYQDDPTAPTLVYAQKDFGCEELLLHAEEIVNFADNSLIYMREGDRREQKARIAYNNKVVKNGELLLDYDGSIFQQKNGTVRLISNSSGEAYTYIFIDTFFNVPFSNVVFNNDELEITNFFTAPKIRFYTGNGGRLTISDDSGAVLSTDDLAKLEKGTLLSIYTDRMKLQNGIPTVAEDAQMLKIVVNTKTVEGKVEGKGVDAGRSFYTIAGADFKLSLSNYFEDAQVEIGSSGTFYLDPDGNLASFKAGDGNRQSFQYGYLIDAHLTKNIDQTLTLKLLATDGNIYTYTCSERVVMNGKTESEMQNIFETLQQSAQALNETKPEEKRLQPEELGVRQLLKYVVNGTQQLTKLETALIRDTSDSERLSLDYPLQYLMTRSNTGYDFMYGTWSTASLGGEFHRPRTLLVVPERDIGIPEEYAYSNQAALEDEEQYWIEAYDMDEGLTPDIGVIYTAADLSKTNEYPVMVDGLTRGLDDQGVEVDIIKCNNGLSNFSYEIMDDYPVVEGYQYDFSTLKRGDVIQIYGVAGKAVCYKQYVDIDNLEDPDVPITPGGDNVDRQFFSEVYYADDNYLVLQRGEQLDNGVKRTQQWTSYYGGTHIMGGVIYDDTGREPVVRMATAADLKPAYYYGAEASLVFTLQSYGEPRFMAIYNLKSK